MTEAFAWPQDAALICREEEQAKARAKAEEEAAAKEAARLVEEAAAAAKAEEIAQAQEIAKAEAEKLHPGASNGNVKSEGAEEDRAASGQAATAAPKLDPAADPIYAAMIAAAKTVPPKPESPAAALEPVGLTTQPPAKKKRVGINPAVLAAFKEEEEKPRMVSLPPSLPLAIHLIPLPMAVKCSSGD